MKSFKQFQQNLHEVVPAALAAPVIGAGMRAAAPFIVGGAAKLVQGMMQAKKQGQGGRSQPSPDYGQSGEGAKPRTPNVQRGRLDPNDAYNRRMRELRRQDAQDRAQERAERGIEELIGTDAERAAAKQARENQPQIQRRLSQRNRMSRAAENIPPEHRAESYLNENVNIEGDFNGNLYINSQSEQTVGESYLADILWEGNLYRLELRGKMLSRDELAENLQSKYPGAMVQQIYPAIESNLDVKTVKRYHPAKLDWV